MTIVHLNSTIHPTPHHHSHLRTIRPSIETYDIVLTLVVFLVLRTFNTLRRQSITSWPLLGMLPTLISAIKGNLYDWLTQTLRHQNGTFEFHGPVFTNLRCIVTSDPRNIQHILKANFQNYPKGPYFRSTVHDLLGRGIFGTDGDPWHKQRTTAGALFSTAKFRRASCESLTRLVRHRLIPMLENSLTRSTPIDLQDVLLRLTFDNVCMIAFGADPGCLNLEQLNPVRCDPVQTGTVQPDPVQFARAFEEATELTFLRFVIPTTIWKTMRYLGIGTERRLQAAISEVDRFVEAVIDKRMHEFEEDDEDRYDLLTVFLKEKQNSKKFLRDVCVNFILAGRDTSSIALTWFLWLIDQHPEVEERILEEIYTLGALRMEEMSKMTYLAYLHAALTEAMRLYPSVPVDHKEAIRDDVLPDGTRVRKGSKVIYAIYAMGRMEGIWGEDCSEFRPERWLRRRDGQWEFKPERVFKFVAFNGGPRLCLGREFAYYQMKFVASSLLSRFKVRVVEGHPVVPKLALTLYMKHGLKVHVYKRDEDELQKYARINPSS